MKAVPSDSLLLLSDVVKWANAILIPEGILEMFLCVLFVHRYYGLCVVCVCVCVLSTPSP